MQRGGRRAPAGDRSEFLTLIVSEQKRHAFFVDLPCTPAPFLTRALRRRGVMRHRTHL
jgi:hypothetical protein